MTEEKFWFLIGEADIREGSEVEQNEKVTMIAERLSKMTIRDIVLFEEMLEEKLIELRAEYHNISEATKEQYGVSSDGFEYFLMWVISRGKLFFESTVSNQKALSVFLKKTQPLRLPEFESFSSIGFDAFEMKKQRFEKLGDTEFAEDRILLLLNEDKNIYGIRDFLANTTK